MFKSKDKAYQAYCLLRIVFIVAPILAGLDKFFYILAYWSNYISPLVLKIINYHDRGFMMVVGVVEIIAGIGVILRPRIFAYVVAAWLLAIILNLLMTGLYFDIALRDVGLMLSALALGSLSQKYGK